MLTDERPRMMRVLPGAGKRNKRKTASANFTRRIEKSCSRQHLNHRTLRSDRPQNAEMVAAQDQSNVALFVTPTNQSINEVGQVLYFFEISDQFGFVQRMVAVFERPRAVVLDEVQPQRDVFYADQIDHVVQMLQQ